jgi:hypothetical protein
MTCKTGGSLVKRRQNCMGVNCLDGQQTRPLIYAGTRVVRGEAPGGCSPQNPLYGVALRSQKNQHKVTFTSQSDFSSY